MLTRTLFIGICSGPCKVIAPTFDKLANQYSGKVNFAKVDVDVAQDVAQKYSVRAMPTFLFLKGSSVVHTVHGARPADLISAVNQYSGGGGSSAFRGQGNKLGDGSSPSINLDPRGTFNLGSEAKIIVFLVAIYVLLMYYT
ncbi:hypothetical protein FRB91_009102 [Serendipita sp. 411]|nr:hypothetical protein FRB91_009102 [Serendipita sp. 411]